MALSRRLDVPIPSEAYICGEAMEDFLGNYASTSGSRGFGSR